MNKFLKRLLRKTRYNSKTNSLVLFLFLLVLLFGVGYAYLNTTLSVDGVVNVENSSWDIHFENIQVQSGSVEATTQPTISNDTTVSFGVTLENPGDRYVFTVDVVNAGTMDAKIDSLTILPELTPEQQEYFGYSVNYSDWTLIEKNDALNAGTTETILVNIIYLPIDDTSLYPDEDIDFNFSVTLDYVQGSGINIHPNNFSTDSWGTIIKAAKSMVSYNVGDTKTVDMGSFGTHTLRIANKNFSEDCDIEGFSQTACGFVLEFADIITTHRMNLFTSGVTTNGNGSIGGWQYSEMRTYLNSDIYNALPEELKNGIINTTVISGHGLNDSNNFTSTDKLYLLSPHEVWEDVDGNPNQGIDKFDAAYNLTRQLDYYAGLNITTSNYSGAIKQRNGGNATWWLRSAVSHMDGYFLYVQFDGVWGGDVSNGSYGVSPAFRIDSMNVGVF